MGVSSREIWPRATGPDIGPYARVGVIRRASAGRLDRIEGDRGLRWRRVRAPRPRSRPGSLPATKWRGSTDRRSGGCGPRRIWSPPADVVAADVSAGPHPHFDSIVLFVGGDTGDTGEVAQRPGPRPPPADQYGRGRRSEEKSTTPRSHARASPQPSSASAYASSDRRQDCEDLRSRASVCR